MTAPPAASGTVPIADPPDADRPERSAGRPDGRAEVLVIGGASHDAIVHLSGGGGEGSAAGPEVSCWYPSVGGTGAGKAMNLSALGFDATLHAVLGADRAGAAVAARLAEAGVRLIAHRGERDTQRHTNLMLPGGGRLSLPVEPPERPASFDPDVLSDTMSAPGARRARSR